MASVPVVFRLPSHLLDELAAVAQRVESSPGLIARLIVTRDLTQTAAMLETHDQKLEHLYLMVRDIARVHRDLIHDGNVAADQSSTRILKKLDEMAREIDSIRDAAFVRNYTTVKDLIAAHDEKPTQQSLPL